VLAVIRKPEFSAEDIISALKPESKGLYLALDGVKDPGNLGTIIRVADWFGVDAIFASSGTVEVYNPKVVQATMGAIFRKRVIYTDLSAVCKRFESAGLPVYGTFLDGKNLYESVPADRKHGLIVMGSESFGISDTLRELIGNKLLIPPYPADASTSESLNVAIATAIICAEFRR
jgi:TrmH family RNA methyltransferase